MATTTALKNRKMRQEQLREWLSQQKLIEKVIDIDREIGELKGDSENPEFDLKKLQARANINFKLIDKYLADLKAVEATVERSYKGADEFTDDELIALASGADSSGSSQSKTQLH